jgi:TolB protein
MRKLPMLRLLLLLALLLCSASVTGRTKVNLKDVFATSKIQKIAYSVSQWKFGRGYVMTHEIYAMTADDPSAKLIQAENSSNPAWSPDGSKLASISFKPGKLSELYVVNADGSNRIQLTTSKDGSGVSCASWSPDGERLAFSARADKIAKIFVINADGSDQRLITKGDCPKWSPDGKQLAFSRYEARTKAQRIRVWITNVDGSDARALTDEKSDSSAPDWLPDGRGVIFASSSLYGRVAIYSSDMAGSVRLIKRSDKYDLYYPNLSPDGKLLVCQMQVEREQPSVVVIMLEGTDIKPVYVAKGGIQPSVVWKR